MNEYYIPEWWYQTFLVIIFAFAVLALVAFIIYKKKVKNEIDSLTENSVRLYKKNDNLTEANSKLAAENERYRSNHLDEHIITTVHPIRKITTKCEMDYTGQLNDAKLYCKKQLMNSELDKFIDWQIEQNIMYCRPVLYASLNIVDPGKPYGCNYPDDCSKCSKVLTCEYYRR